MLAELLDAFERIFRGGSARVKESAKEILRSRKSKTSLPLSRQKAPLAPKISFELGVGVSCVCVVFACIFVGRRNVILFTERESFALEYE
jgi:hypothetical protein